MPPPSLPNSHIKDFFSHLPFFAFVLDEKDEIVFWNHSLALLLGIQENTSKDVIHKHKIICLALLKIKSLRNNTLPEKNGDISFVNDDGSKKFMTISINSCSINDQVFTVCAMSDETKRVQKENHLLKIATTDHLTGAYNRRHTISTLENEVERFRRGKTSSSLLFMDLDHFKKINDVHGHHVGDEVLKTFSEIVQKRIRSLDSFGRIGGEEFCLFLSDTDKEQAEFVAKNLLSLFQKTPISALSGTVHFTASIGISTMNEKYENVDQWLQDADKALYHAKNTGRNRACHIDDIKQESTLSSEHAREAKR